MLVRMANGLQHLYDQLDARAHGKFALLAPVRQINAVNVLHCDPGQLALAVIGIDHPRNIRVVHLRDHLLFKLEAHACVLATNIKSQYF